MKNLLDYNLQQILIDLFNFCHYLIRVISFQWYIFHVFPPPTVGFARGGEINFVIFEKTYIVVETTNRELISKRNILYIRCLGLIRASISFRELRQTSRDYPCTLSISRGISIFLSRPTGVIRENSADGIAIYSDRHIGIKLSSQ